MSDNGAGSGTGSQGGDQSGAGGQTQDVNDTIGSENDDDFDKDRALNTIKAQRASEKALKQQLADLQAQIKAKDDSTLTEQQKLQKKIDDMEAALKDQQTKAQRAVLRSTITVEATELGFRNPALAHRLVDADEIEYDTDGQPTNVKRLLRDLLKQDPYLAGVGGGGDGGAGRGRGDRDRPQDMNSVIRQMAGRE